MLPIQTPPPVSWGQIKTWAEAVDANGRAKGVEVLGVQLLLRDKAIEALLVLLELEGYRSILPAARRPK